MKRGLLLLFAFLAVLVISTQGAPTDEEFQDNLSEGHVRVKRVTCDIIGSIEAKGIKLNDAACAAHCLSLGKTGGYCNGQKKMEADGVVPDSLDEAPSAKIAVTYPNGKEVEFGGELTPSEVKEQPKVSWDGHSNKLYTLSMVDPDAPSREDPKYREFNHWLIVNIQGTNLSTGETLTSYRGSGPPKGTGLHRYIFIVFEQKEKIAVEERDLETARRNFSIRKFSKKYGLGKPYAGNFFKAQYETKEDE